MKLNFKDKDIKLVIYYPKIDFPKYSTQIINLANQNSQATRPKNVGQMSELIKTFRKEISHGSLADWEEWYKKKHPKAINRAIEKISEMVNNLKNVIDEIDESLIEKWVNDLIINKTYLGLNFQDAILEYLSEKYHISYKLSLPADEAKGIDGYLKDIPISIKASTYKFKKVSKQEKINVSIIYYEKKKTSVEIEVPDELISKLQEDNSSNKG